MFISIDGPDGGGKTTQLSLLAKWLSESGVANTITKEPGTPNSNECKQIREIILNPSNDIVDRTELFLYLADRAQNVERHILPALARGEWVISDRYSDSTKVYQGLVRGLGLNVITPMIQYASHDLNPDITFILDISAEIGLARAKKSNAEFVGGDRIELEDLGFHDQVRAGFLTLALTDDRYLVLDAMLSIDELHDKMVAHIKKVAKEKR